MTATMIARLVDRGLMRWDMTIADAFPAGPAIHEKFRAVRLDQLLTTRAGIPHQTPAALWANLWQRLGSPTEPRLQLLDGTCATAPEQEPSTKFVYANQGFAIAGEDRRFHPADVAYAEKAKDDRGQIQHDRKQLVLTSPMVPEPIHFRYAWGRNPLANLQTIGNKDIPFATQRSDEWKMEEVPLGVLGEEVTLPLSGADRNKIIQALREQDRERRLKEAEQIIKASGGTKSP